MHKLCGLCIFDVHRLQIEVSCQFGILLAAGGVFGFNVQCIGYRILGIGRFAIGCWRESDEETFGRFAGFAVHMGDMCRVQPVRTCKG